MKSRKVELVPFEELYPALLEAMENTKPFEGLYEELEPKFKIVQKRYQLCMWIVKESDDEVQKAYELKALDLHANRFYLSVMEQIHSLSSWESVAND